MKRIRINWFKIFHLTHADINVAHDYGRVLITPLVVLVVYMRSRIFYTNISDDNYRDLLTHRCGTEFRVNITITTVWHEYRTLEYF